MPLVKADVELVREALKEHNIDAAMHVVRDGALAADFINPLDRDPTSPVLVMREFR